MSVLAENQHRAGRVGHSDGKYVEVTECHPDGPVNDRKDTPGTKF